MKIRLRGGWARAGHSFVNPGEVTDVDAAVAQEMVDGGFAELVDDSEKTDKKAGKKKAAEE